MQSGYRAPWRRLQCTGWRRGVALLLLMAAGAVQAAVPAATASARPQRTVLVMGDSLSAAYGLAPSQGWVALTGARLAQQQRDMADRMRQRSGAMGGMRQQQQSGGQSGQGGGPGGR